MTEQPQNEQPSPEPGATEQPSPEPGATEQPSAAPSVVEQPTPATSVVEQPTPEPSAMEQPASPTTESAAPGGFDPAALASERPELAVGAAFMGGLVLAAILRRFAAR